MRKSSEGRKKRKKKRFKDLRRRKRLLADERLAKEIFSFLKEEYCDNQKIRT